MNLKLFRNPNSSLIFVQKNLVVAVLNLNGHRLKMDGLHFLFRLGFILNLFNTH